MKKRFVIALLAALTVFTASGCGAKEEKEYKRDDVVVTSNGMDMDYSSMSVYEKLMETEAYSYMMKEAVNIGAGMSTPWTMPLGENNEFETFGDQFEFETKNSLKSAIACVLHMDEYDVEFTDEDMQKCETAAKKMIEEMSNETLEAMHGDVDSIAGVLRLMAIENRVQKEMLYQTQDNVDENVDTKDYQQSTYSYTIVRKSADATPKETSELIYNEVKDGKTIKEAADAHGAIPFDVSFTTADPEYKSNDEEVMKLAVKVKEGEVERHEMKNGDFVVIKMIAVEDKEASEQKKNEIIEQRKKDYCDALIRGWIKEDEIIIDEKAWETISPDEMKVFKVMEKQEEEEPEVSEKIEVTDENENSGVSVNVLGGDEESGAETTEGTDDKENDSKE